MVVDVAAAADGAVAGGADADCEGKVGHWDGGLPAGAGSGVMRAAEQ